MMTKDESLNPSSHRMAGGKSPERKRTLTAPIPKSRMAESEVMQIDKTNRTPVAPAPEYDPAARGRGSASGLTQSHVLDIERR